MAVQIPFPLPSEGYALNSKVRINLDFLVDQFNQFNSGTATWDNVSVGTANSLTGTITLYNSSNANYLTIRPGVTAASVTYTLPTDAPTVGTTGLLKTTSAGVMSWVGATSFITGTANQVIVTDSSGTAVLSTPQSIGTGSSPTFAGLTVSGLSNNYLTWTNAGVLTGLSNSQGTTAMLIGSSGGTPKYVKLLGTSNQITVTFNTDDTTLSLPQSIATSSDVQFGTVKTGAGTITNTALKLNANNTGIYMSSATEMDFVIGGVTYGVLDTSGNWFATTGETRANVVRGLSSLKVGGTVGSIVTIVSGASSNYTLTLPTTDGNANEVLLTDGSGNLSWSSVTGAAGAATKALDNLASVAINTTLVSDTDNTDDLGTTAIGWRSLYLATSIKSGATTLATTTELGYLTGVTSAIQTQLNAKKATATGNAYKFETTDASGNLQETTVTASRAVATDANGLPTASATTATELGYVSGVTSAIQTQINAKAADSSVVHLSGTESITGAKTFSAQTLFADGSAGTPSIGFSSDTDTGRYWISANKFGEALGGVRAIDHVDTGSADDVNYVPLRFWGGQNSGGTQGGVALESASASVTTSPKQIWSSNLGDGNFIIVHGKSGSAQFCDVIVTTYSTTAPTVIVSHGSGGPAARTYAQTSAGIVTLQMGSGTYGIHVAGFGIQTRG